MQIVGNKTPRQGNHGPPPAGPNYISQDEDAEHSHGYITRSRMTSIMQEAMLACIDITKPNFKISAAKMASRQLPMMWFCEMANSVLGEHGKLLEIGTSLPIPRLGRHGPTHMGTILDVSRKECQGEQRERTQFSSSLDTWYRRRGHAMSHTGSSRV